MPQTLEFTYGEDKLALNFPDGFLAGELVRPRPAGPPLCQKELAAKIDEALSRPVGRPRLAEMAAGKSVAIVISDEFRAGLQKHILDRMLVEAWKGGPSRLAVFVSTGSHAPEIYAKNIVPWFHESCQKHGIAAEIFANDCDKSEHVVLGRTSLGARVELMKDLLRFEVRAYGHESKHHYMNGYSIIDKQVVPGLASRKCIEENHKFALDSDHSLGGRSPWHHDPARRANPFAQGAADGRLMSERFQWRDGRLSETPAETFNLEMISTKVSIDWIYSGDPDEGCRRMIVAADKLAAFALPKTRYAAISPGGPPACNAIYGVQNCFDMALKGALVEGGEALILAPCLGRPDLPPEVRGLAPDAKSKALFWDNLCRFLAMPLDQALDYIDKHFELYLWKTDRVLKLMRASNIKLYLYSELPPEIIEKGGFTPVKDPQAWIDERASRGDGQLRAINDGNKLLVVGE
ncbi:MAG: DUF2088 domain-containing protein [Myxococcales bacterium]|nr:MAG: DUF2088 domain-containing protein [Myxococcales bacterium]